MLTKRHLSGLLFALLCFCVHGCADEAETQTPDQSEWIEAYGAQGPFEQVQSTGKADGLGRPGPQASWDGAA